MAKGKKSVLARAKEQREIAEARLAADVAKFRRKQIRQLSTYQAAASNRLTNEWSAPTATADAAIINDAGVLNARARAAVRDDGNFKSIVHAFRRDVVGTGITPRSAAKDPFSGKETDLFKQFNADIDALWDEWARGVRLCDVEERKSFLGIQRLAISEMVTVGESFVAPVYKPSLSGDVPDLRLQMFEPEQLDLTQYEYQGRDIEGGVEISGTGAAVAYWLDADQDVTTEKKRIPSESIIHLMLAERVRQTRGVTWFAPSLIKGRHLNMYVEYMIVRARLEASACAFIERDVGMGDSNFGLPLEAGADSLDATGNTEHVLEPGTINRLDTGERINFYKPQNPSSEYGEFVRSQIRQIASGVGLDYATIARDYSEGTYSSQRQGMLVLWKEIDPIQILMIDVFLRPVRELFKKVCIAEGRVDAPGYKDSPAMKRAYLSDDWRGPARPWIDPAKQAAAIKMAMEMGLTSYQSELNEQGKDYREVFKQRKAEIDYADGLDLTLPGLNAPSKVAPQEPRPDKKPSNGDSGLDRLIKNTGRRFDAFA